MLKFVALYPILAATLWVSVVESFVPLAMPRSFISNPRLASGVVDASEPADANWKEEKSTELDKAIRVGVIGCGRIGIVHLGAIQKVPGCEVVVVSNPTMSKAEAAAKEFNVPR